MEKEFKFGIKSPNLFQLGIVVKDIDEAILFMSNTLNLGPFTVMRGFTAPAGSYRGSTKNPVLNMAHVYAGSLFIELIQQLDDTPSVYTEHVEKYGYGLHHFGLAVDPEKYDTVLQSFLDRGYEVVFRDQLPTGARIRYVTPKYPKLKDSMVRSSGAGFLECVEMIPAEEDFFNEMKVSSEA